MVCGCPDPLFFLPLVYAGQSQEKGLVVELFVDGKSTLSGPHPATRANRHHIKIIQNILPENHIPADTRISKKLPIRPGLIVTLRHNSKTNNACCMMLVIQP